MKIFLPVLIAFFSFRASAQTILIADTGHVTFYSYAPLEDIKATSTQLNSVINTVTGEIAFIVPMRSFRFAKALMQEHFNEKYIESDKYPQATFKGKINEKVDFSKAGEMSVTASGKFSIHGKEKDITEKGFISINPPNALLTCEFFVALADYNITKPQILFNNIADTIDVKMKLLYAPFKKK